jgi:hypothetical protein
MSVKKEDSRQRNASRWAARLMNSVRAVLAVRPEADPENVRHTLILLEHPPFERLRRSLTRGRALAQRSAKDRLVIPVLEDSLAASKVAARRGTRKPSSPRKRKPCRYSSQRLG